MDFEDIHSAFRPRIHRYLARIVGVKEAEDLTQEVFVRVSQGLKTFRGKSQLSTWVYRIATNAAIDMKRSTAYRQSAQSTELRESVDIGSKAMEAGESTASTQRQVERKEMNKCIRDFVDNLPENYRSVLVLSDLEGMKDSEIAEILGITLSTVKIRLHRAKDVLKKKLQTHCEFYRDERNEFACDLKSAYQEIE